MARVDKSDLSKVNKDISFLDTIESESKTIISNIELFINNSTSVLTGSAYDSVRNRLKMYIDALTKQSTIASTLKQNITSVNNSMSNYMDIYSTLDDSNIEKTERAIENAKQQIRELNSYLTSYGNMKGVNISEIKAAIASLTEESTRLEKLLEILKGLKGKDAELSGQLNSITNDVNNYKNAINDITITSYVS